MHLPTHGHSDNRFRCLVFALCFLNMYEIKINRLPLHSLVEQRRALEKWGGGCKWQSCSCNRSYKWQSYSANRSYGTFEAAAGLQMIQTTKWILCFPPMPAKDVYIVEALNNRRIFVEGIFKFFGTKFIKPKSQ